MTPIVVAIVFLGLVLGIGVGLLWQEYRRIPERAVIYGEEDSIEFIMARLSDRARAVLKPEDVGRILGWSVRYLQDPYLRRDRDAPPVAGGEEAAEYVQAQAREEGFSCDGPVILEVLNLQTEYLVAIGAVGDPVEDEG